MFKVSGHELSKSPQPTSQAPLIKDLHENKGPCWVVSISLDCNLLGFSFFKSNFNTGGHHARMRCA